jgi:transposase
MKQSVVYIGIDVAKAHLDVAWAQSVRRLPNQRSGHTTLIRWIKQSTTPVQLICEASGGYEQALLESLEKSEVKVTLVQAVRVRQYARAAGILAKTDKIDAKVLAAFGSAIKPQPTRPLSAQQKRLRQYEAQRRHLSRILVAEENRLAQLSCAELRTLSRSLMSKIKKQIETLDRRIGELITQDQTLWEKAQKLTAIRASVRARLRSCSRKCPSLANSIVVKPLLWPAWRHLTTTVAQSAASAPSLVDAALCAPDFTWLHFRPLASIRSYRAFTNVCVPKGNRTNSLSQQSCGNSFSLSITPSNPNQSSLETNTVTYDGIHGNNSGLPISTCRRLACVLVTCSLRLSATNLTLTPPIKPRSQNNSS